MAAAINPLPNLQPISDLDKLKLALCQKNIAKRCCDVAGVLNGVPVGDAAPLLPTLVESIFGNATGTTGWELRTLTKTTETFQDFSTMFNFLAANGPLLTVLYKLTMDPTIAFNFPITFLPLPTQKLIEEGNIPLFFLNKIKFPSESSALSHLMPTPPAVVTHLTLNAFELYVFHFAFYMVNMTQSRIPPQLTGADFIYSSVFEHYLQTFLPASSASGGDLLIPALSTYVAPGTWASQSAASQRALCGMSGAAATATPFKSGILRANLCPVSPSSSSMLGFSTMAVGDSDSGGLFRQSWRSETFLSVVVEFWLNQNAIDMSKYASSIGSGPQSYLPSIDVVRCVRLLVKQVHYFANLSRHLSPVPPHYQSSGSTSQVDNSMNEFRSAAVPVFLLKKIYAFLRHGFEKWPLDQGFRMVLETWLSYIQPWRYVDLTVTEKEEETRVEVGEEWLVHGFIRENLLHYVAPFEDFVKRLFRMDLSSPKNAQMLFRVCKVFNQTRLKEFLQSVELSVASSAGAPIPIGRTAFQDSFYDGASFLSPSNGLNSAFLAQVADMEKPDFVYKPLFGPELRGSVEQLIQVIDQALATTKSLLPPEPNHATETKGGFMGLVSSVLGAFSASQNAGLSDDLTMADVKRMEVHLKQSLQHLVEIFEVEPPSNTSASSLTGGGSLDDHTLVKAGVQSLGPNAPDHVDGVLTETGRWQLKNGLKQFDVMGFHGDPDLHPIQSLEITFLVRILYKVSCAINDRYFAAFARAFARGDLLGKIARKFLVAPCIAENASPSQNPCASSGKPCSHVNKYSRKPRISLRFLAHKQTLGWLGAALLVAPSLGIGRLAFLCYVFLVTFFGGVLNAVLRPVSV